HHPGNGASRCPTGICRGGKRENAPTILDGLSWSQANARHLNAIYVSLEIRPFAVPGLFSRLEPIHPAVSQRMHSRTRQSHHEESTRRLAQLAPCRTSLRERRSAPLFAFSSLLVLHDWRH